MEFDLKGKIRNMPSCKTRPLLPLFEAISNSIHAIIQSGNNDDNDRIQIIINREPKADDLFSNTNQVMPIDSIEVLDNGIGFNNDNFNSFGTAESTYKISFGAKGVGRFYWLKVFNSVSISSVYKEGAKTKQRAFDFLFTKEGITNVSDVEIENQSITPKTSVKLLKLKKFYKDFYPKKLDEIARSIIDHFIIYFLLEECPIIELSDDDDKYVLNELFTNEIESSVINKPFSSESYELNLFLAKIHRPYWNYHSIHLCANKRCVKNVNLSTKMPDLQKKIIDDDNNSYLYQVYVTGECLDCNVNSERTEFISLESNDDKLALGENATNEIIDEAIKQVKVLLKDYLDKVSTKKLERISHFVNEKSPQYRYLIKHHEDLIEDIPLGLPEEKLEISLYEIHNKLEVQNKIDVQELIHKDVSDVKNLDEYKQRYYKFVNELNDIGQYQLAKYVIHRKAVLDLLSKFLQLKDNNEHWPEDVLHNLIFPMHKTSEDIYYEEQNLWVIDERLSFHQHLASDIRLDQNEMLDTESQHRPDILIFDHPYAFVGGDVPYGSIHIIELKKPSRNDYSESKNPDSQIKDYITKIKDGRAKDKNGEYISVNESTIFNAIILCDLSPTAVKIFNREDYYRSTDGLGYFKYHKYYNAYIEVVSYKKLVKDANQRNKILFHKLGII